MKVEEQSKILKEDIPDSPEWVDTILYAFNTLLQNFYNLVNKNIDDSNIRCQVKTITIVTTATYPTDFTPISFPNELKVRATSCVISQCIEKPSNIGIAVSGCPGWNQQSTNIVISNISGLAASKTYSIRLRIT